MIVKVPITKVEKVGLRGLVEAEDIETVYEILQTRELVDQTTWNRRQREYTEKIRTGSIFEVAEVMRDLCLLRTGKDLSFGERKMLDKAQGLLVKELSLATETEVTEPSRIRLFEGASLESIA